MKQRHEMKPFLPNLCYTCNRDPLIRPRWTIGSKKLWSRCYVNPLSKQIRGARYFLHATAMAIKYFSRDIKPATFFVFITVTWNAKWSEIYDQKVWLIRDLSLLFDIMTTFREIALAKRNWFFLAQECWNCPLEALWPLSPCGKRKSGIDARSLS